MFKLKMVEKPELLNLKTNVEFPPVYVQTDHSKLENLDYKNSGHIGFASSNDLEKKVDKIDGKGLSTNDYTNDEKNKLAELENYTLPIASNAKLGGIKIGENLTITEDGILSATGGGGVGIPEAPIDGFLYGRKNGNWDKIPDSINIYKTITDADVPANNTIILNIDEIKISDCLFINRIGSGKNTFIKFNENDNNFLSLSDGIYQFVEINKFNNSCYIIGNNVYGIYYYKGSIININRQNQYKLNLDEVKNIDYINTNSTIDGTKTFTTLPKSSVNPTDNNHFTRKGYVDALPTTYAGYDATKTQVLKNINGVLTWQDE